MFAISSKSITYLEMNLTKEGKDPYSENNKTLKKEIEKIHMEDIPCS